MLNFEAFFAACAGTWTTERTYHFVTTGEIERSYTEFVVETLTLAEKQKLLFGSSATDRPFANLQIAADEFPAQQNACPGFAIAFNTRSETGETVSMNLQALFIPDTYVLSGEMAEMPLPPAAAIAQTADQEIIQGFYLRNQGYSEAGAIAGRFTYQPTRQTLEMITYYRRSVAVDQMRMLGSGLRARTIITYARPTGQEPLTVIDLIGFGVEQRQGTPA